MKIALTILSMLCLAGLNAQEKSSIESTTNNKEIKRVTEVNKAPLRSHSKIKQSSQAPVIENSNSQPVQSNPKKKEEQ